MTAGPCVALGCESAHTRRYLNGPACPEHSPWALNHHPDPSTQVDPTRTERVLRVFQTPLWAKGGTDLNKERPGGYKSRQRAVREAAERDALSTLQHPERAS